MMDISLCEILILLFLGKRIPPIVAFFVECEDCRNYKLSCDNNIADFFVNKVIPWCRKRYNISHKPEDCIISGLSLGGLFASYMGLNHSNIFGNVLSQSGSYWWYPNYDSGKPLKKYKSNGITWMAESFQEHEKLNLKFYLEVGALERDRIINGSKNMRDILLSKGYHVQYSEFQGGHDYLSWRETLAKGLRYLTRECDTPISLLIKE
ncbi:alpha/beta hydrolase [Oceanirhabdus seepicola]|uniref:Esterase family protein n=1 Tax=Oceanirhabdus seepicola TaxID=2828781 RepID=A0A9J6P6K6_9CLOT|nr:alpha/beta hydrolase-fold protein [Oceanirhabdus seepicola]MCM1992474.1 esterase family protein [Oceanirhabdus seepicola]